jgi:hypothetical protein
MKNPSFLIVFLLIASCSTVPFRETAYAPVGAENPQSLVQRFQASLPDKFQLLNTVVFEYNWRKFAAVGYLDIDRQAGAFKVACLNPMGVKLFELSGDRNSITDLYTIAAFSRYGDITTVVGNDIRRIYFDLVPSAHARIWKRTYSMSFRQPSGAGTLEYIFSGPQADLVEKNYYDNDGLSWRVSYYEYRDQNGKRFPQGIVLLNYHYHYRLTVRHREYRS